MAGYNRIIIMGNLTRDPEYKQLTSGQSVCRLGLASNRQFKNRQTGLAVQEVCFVDVDVWGAQAESCQQYLQKGRAVLVEGRLKLDSWQDNDGQKRNKHLIVADRVVFLSVAAQVDTGFEQAETEKLDQTEKSEVGTSNVSPNLDSVTSEMLQYSGTENKKETEKEAAKVAAEENIKHTVEEEEKSEKEARKSDQFGSGEVNFTDQKPFEDDLPF